jgi:hypothetical protein
VVLPRAVDLEVALGDAFLTDAEDLHHPAAVGVARHDADLQTMEMKFVEREAAEDDDSLGDVAVAGVTFVDPVARPRRTGTRRGPRC